MTIRVGAGPNDTADVLEERIERAASLSARYITEGYAVAVQCGSADVGLGRGRDHLLVILRELALCDVSRLDHGRRAVDPDVSRVIEL